MLFRSPHDTALVPNYSDWMYRNMPSNKFVLKFLNVVMLRGYSQTTYTILGAKKI